MELILLSPVPTPNEILRLFILYRLVKLKVELRGRNPKLGLSLQFWFKLGSLALLADRFISGLICRNGLGEFFWQCVIFSFCFWEALATADPDFGLSLYELMLADDFLGLVEEKKLGVRLMDDGISWLPTNCGPPCHRLPPKILMASAGVGPWHFSPS